MLTFLFLKTKPYGVTTHWHRLGDSNDGHNIGFDWEKYKQEAKDGPKSLTWTHSDHIWETLGQI